MAISHSSYSFPILSQSEILACLNELEMEVEDAQLAKPNYDFVRALYENLVVLLVSLGFADPAPSLPSLFAPPVPLKLTFPRRRSLLSLSLVAGRHLARGDAAARLQRHRLLAVSGAPRQQHSEHRLQQEFEQAHERVRPSRLFSRQGPLQARVGSLEKKPQRHHQLCKVSRGEALPLHRAPGPERCFGRQARGPEGRAQAAGDGGVRAQGQQRVGKGRDVDFGEGDHRARSQASTPQQGASRPSKRNQNHQERVQGHGRQGRGGKAKGEKTNQPRANHARMS